MKNYSIIKKLQYAFILIMFFLVVTNHASALLENPTAQTIQLTQADIQPGISNAENNLNNVATNPEVGYKDNMEIEEIIGKIIKTVLSIVGILFLILIIVSGLQWMTAGGNEDTINKAKAKLKNSIIGLAIVLLSFTISTFVFNVLNQRP